MGSDAASASAVTAQGGSAPVREIPRAAHSRFVQRVRRRYGDELALVADGLPDRTTIGALIERLQSGGAGLSPRRCGSRAS